MKRLICMLILFCLCVSGCSMTGERLKEPVTFYYVYENYRKDMNQVIASELREASAKQARNSFSHESFRRNST